MKNKYLILFLLIAITTTAFFYFGNISIDTKGRKIKAYDKRIKEEQEKLNSAKVLNNQLAEVSKVIIGSITKERTYSAEEINGFVKKIATLADKYEITVNGIVPKVVTSTSRSFVRQQYTLELNCTFVQMGNFLAELESFDNIMEVNSLNVSPVATKENVVLADTRYRVTMLLTTVKIFKEA